MEWYEVASLLEEIARRASKPFARIGAATGVLPENAWMERNPIRSPRDDAAIAAGVQAAQAEADVPNRVAQEFAPGPTQWRQPPEPTDEMEQAVLRAQMAAEADRMAQASRATQTDRLGMPYSPLRQQMGQSSPIFDAPDPMSQMRQTLEAVAPAPPAPTKAVKNVGAPMEQPKEPGTIKGKKPRKPTADELRGMQRFGGGYAKQVNRAQQEQASRRLRMDSQKGGRLGAVSALANWADTRKGLADDMQMRQGWMADPAIAQLIEEMTRRASPMQPMNAQPMQPMNAAPPPPSNYAYESVPYNQMNKTQAKLKYGSRMEQPRDPQQEFLAWLGTLPF